jgi:thioredoxin-dependent peroxiredoxin
MATRGKSATRVKKAPAKKKAAGAKVGGSAKKTTAKKTTKKGGTTTSKAAGKAKTAKASAAKPNRKAAAKPAVKLAAKAAKPANTAMKPAAKKPAPASGGTNSSGGGSSAVDKGMRAPEFKLRSTGGDTISLRDYIGRKHVVLYFYPKDMTPGCTIEACAFRDRKSEMEDRGAVVLGVSPDSVESHGKFTDMHGLNFPLLADDGAELAKKYDVWKEKNLYGKKSMGIERTTFLIDRDGKVARVWRKVKVEGHDDDVIAALEDL